MWAPLVWIRLHQTPTPASAPSTFVRSAYRSRMEYAVANAGSIAVAFSKA